MLLHSTADKLQSYCLSGTSTYWKYYCPNAHKLECFWLCASNTLTTTTPCPGRAFVRGRTWALCTWRKCLDVEPDGDLLAWMYGCMKYAKWDWFSLQKYSTSFLLLLWGEAKKKLCPLSFQKVLWIQDPCQKKRYMHHFAKSKQACSCHSRTKWIHVDVCDQHLYEPEAVDNLSSALNRQLLQDISNFSGLIGGKRPLTFATCQQ